MTRTRLAIACALVLALTAPAVRAGAAAEFRATTLEGDTLQLSSFRGQVVVIDFWASWCPPCREQLERLAALEKELPGLVVLAVSVDTRRDKVDRYVKHTTMPRRVLLDPKGTIAARYAVQGMPWTVLVDPRGQIVSARAGWESSEFDKLAAEVRRLQGRGTGD